MNFVGFKPDFRSFLDIFGPIFGLFLIFLAMCAFSVCSGVKMSATRITQSQFTKKNFLDKQKFREQKIMGQSRQIHKQTNKLNFTMELLHAVPKTNVK